LKKILESILKVITRVSPYFQNEKIEPKKIEPKKSNRKIEPKIEPKLYPASNWEEVYENIRKMRADKTAPVDTLGCDECYAKCATDKERRFQVHILDLRGTLTRCPLAIGLVTDELSNE